MSGAVRRKMPKGRPFQKGVSGNPGGKVKSEHHIQHLARQYTPEALKALVAALKSPRERVPAAIALLDRGWGKPVTMIAADPERPLQIDFQWADAGANGVGNSGNLTPATHTDARAVGTQIEAAIIDAAIEDDNDK